MPVGAHRAVTRHGRQQFVAALSQQPRHAKLGHFVQHGTRHEARHEAYWAMRTLYPGRDSIATDVCVPISRLTECIMETQADIKAMGVPAGIVGHVGDGNFHTQPMVDTSNPKEMEAIEIFLKRLSERAVRMDGTCTGEHGVGQGKRKYLIAEHGAALEPMRAIKKALDPLGILNPGKIIPVAD